MNLPVLLLLVSAVSLIQVATIMCLFVDTRDLNELSLKSMGTVKQNSEIDEPILRDKTTAANLLYNTLPVLATSETGVREMVHLPGNIEDNNPGQLDQVVNENGLALKQENTAQQMIQRPDVYTEQIHAPRVSTDTKKYQPLSLKVGRQHLPLLQYDRQMFKNKALKHKTKSSSHKYGQERTRQGITDIYQLKGFDGDKGSVKFEKKVVRTATGQKELNWVIKITQIVEDIGDNDSKREVVVNKDEDRASLVEEKKNNSQPSENAEENTKEVNAKENSPHRHLLEFSAKENIDIVNVQKDFFKNKNEATGDNSDSSGDDGESEVPVSAGSDTANVVATEKNDVKEQPESPDQYSEQTEARKNAPENVDMSFLLRRDLQNEIEDPQQSDLTGALNSEKKRDKLLDEAVDRLENAYNIDFLKRRRGNANKGEDYDDKDVDGSKINELIKDGERDEKMVKGLKIDKRSIEDVIGNYGVSVDEDNDDNVVKEYDVEINNKANEVRRPRETKRRRVKDMRLPREAKKRRLRRESGIEHTTRSTSEPEGISGKEGNQTEKTSSPNVTAKSNAGEEAKKNRNKMKQKIGKHGEAKKNRNKMKQKIGKHGDTNTNPNGDTQIFVGYIHINKEEMGNAMTQTVLANADQNGNVQDPGNNNSHAQRNIPNHHRRSCNCSHGSKENSNLNDSSVHNNGHNNGGEDTHPCHHHHHHRNPHWARNADHHVTGRNEASKSDHQHTSQQRNDADSGAHISTGHHTQNNDHVKQSSETHPHVSPLPEIHLPEIHSAHVQATESIRVKNHLANEKGEIMVESFRSESGNGVAGSHSHHMSHPGNAVHVLVIISIFLICFTAIMFIIVRNRSSGGRVREMNSRTALFVPQAKY